MQIGEARKNGEGAIAEYIKVHTGRLFRTPANINAIEASGLILVGMTAFCALESIAKIESEQTVFINGGSTSVGRAAIQIAKARGCKVVTACSAGNMDAMKQLGADEVCLKPPPESRR